MNFIKKNIIFAIVCSMTLIVSGYLIYLDILKHSEVVTANETATSNRKEGEDIYKRGANRPVPENASKIRTDAEEMLKRAKELQLIFGNIYRAALQEFAKRVGIPEQKLIASFRELYDAEKEKKGGAKTAHELVPLFFKKLTDQSKAAWDEAQKLPEKERPKGLKLLTDKQIDDALYAFADLAVREDLEDLRVEDKSKVRQAPELINVFASSLGLPREMGSSLAANYLAASQSIMETQHLIPGIKSKDRIKELLDFKQFEDRQPDGTEIDQILETMPILVDIFRRMQASRIEKLITFTRQVSNVSEKYKKYTFRCSMEGSFDSIRNFCANLQSAYVNNRVYVVRWVSLENVAKQTEVTKIQAYAEGKADDLRKNSSSDRESSKMRTSHVRTEAESNSDPHYGETVIGLNKNVIAEIDFDYYIYLGNQIKKDQQ